MSKRSWIIASVLIVILAGAGIGLLVHGHNQELERMQAQLAEVREGLTKSQAEAASLNGKLAESRTRIEDLQKEKETAVQSHRTLEDEMRTALESKDVTISKLQGKLTVNILDRILFDSGEAELKPDGSDVLRKVGAILTQHPELKIHVIGHTDNVPIRPAARNRFPSNWELSTARATAAVRFLTEQAGIDPRRLGAVGYGEFRPVADNATAEGRARNRRIAITILSEEMAGADTVPTATNAPPLAVSAPAPTNAPGVTAPVPSSATTNAPVAPVAVPAVTNTPPADTNTPPAK